MSRRTGRPWVTAGHRAIAKQVMKESEKSDS